VPSILVFSDLHASEIAIRELKDVIEKVDISIFCGDILGYGNDIDFSIDFIKSKVDLAVRGNHDRMCISNENLDNQAKVVRESILKTRKKLTNAQREFLSSLPEEIWYKDMYITHSLNDKYLRTVEDFKLLLSKGKPETKYFFFGHTHERVFYKVDKKIVLNPGSITKGRNNFSRGYLLIENNNVNFIDLGDLF
jgi:putative phosphoesterase